MAPSLTSEAWTQIRHDYEHTERPIHDICAEHGISDGTLRDRVRRWGWARRRPPIPREGPTPVPAPQIGAAALPLPNVSEPETTAPALPTVREFDAATSLAAAPQSETAAPCLAAVPHAAAGESTDAPDTGAINSPIVPRLQSAVARVLPAIEATVAKLGAGSMQPHDMERAARALASLTRTLRELNSLLGQHRAVAVDRDDDDPVPEDIDEFRRELARRIHAFVDERTGERTGQTDAGSEPEKI